MKKKIIIIVALSLVAMTTILILYSKNTQFENNIVSIDDKLDLEVFVPEIDKILEENNLDKKDLLLDEAKTFDANGGYELDVPLKSGGRVVVFKLDNEPDNIQAVYIPPDYEGDVIGDEAIQESY